MLSFPSALNRAGNSAEVSNIANGNLRSTNGALFDTSRMKAFNMGLNTEVIAELYNPENMNISNYARYINGFAMNSGNDDFKISNQEYKDMLNFALSKKTGEDQYYNQYDKVNNIIKYNEKYNDLGQTYTFYENPFNLPSGLIQSVNRYTHVYKTPVNELLNLGGTISGDYKKLAGTGGSLNKPDNLKEFTSGITKSGDEKVNKSGTARQKKIKRRSSSTVSKAIKQKYDYYVNYAQTPVVSSIFNPMYMIQVVGMTENVPLLSNVHDINTGLKINYKDPNNKDNYITETINPLNGIVDNNLTNCTMRELVRKSHKHNSILGQARYKYADFIYCKDLGKVSNNHLITLRKFAHPVGDNIFRMTSPKFRTQYPGGPPEYDTEGDVGRLVSWFGTEDNKLEDIAKFSVGASWKELEATIQALGEHKDENLMNVSQINSANAGGIGGVSTNNADVTSGIQMVIPDAPRMDTFQQAMIYAPMGIKLHTDDTPTRQQMIDAASNIFQNGGPKGKNFRFGSDKNKIYTPKNTIQGTHVYEGKLTFEQEFTLNFSYKLRAYDNINPKSAFLDLLGNILEVTYRRGKFWGGARTAIGPTDPAGGGSPSGHPHGGGRPSGSHPHGGGANSHKVENVAEDNWDFLEGWARGLASGDLNWQDIMASISDLVNMIANGAAEIAQALKDGYEANGVLGFLAAALIQFRDTFSSLADGENPDAGEGAGGSAAGGAGRGRGSGGASRGAGGSMAKSTGKPAMYAMDSLLKGDNVGLWHLTVGNPKNPIFVCGNLILTKATVTHSGPLGIDDFPTELKVSCTLKHGRARDLIEIEKMYTKGTNSIYHVVDRNRLSDFFSIANSELEAHMDQARFFNDINSAYEEARAKLEKASSQEMIEYIRKASIEQYRKQFDEMRSIYDENKTSKKEEREIKQSDEEIWAKIQEKDGYIENVDVGDNGTVGNIFVSVYKDYLDSKTLLKETVDEYEGILAEMYGNQNTAITGKDGKTAENTVNYIVKDDTNYGIHTDYSKLNDVSIYVDDEFEDERGKELEYIKDSRAIRYETLGQDRDRLSRLIADENA